MASDFTVEVNGQASHAAHPSENRKDALVAASEMVLAIENTANKYDDLSTTVGVFNVSPSVYNIFAGKVFFSYDVRDINDELKKEALKKIQTDLKKISNKRNVEITTKRIWNIDGTYFSEEIKKLIKKSVKELNYSYESVDSGAGHDSKFMNDISETAMIFAPSVNGLSHCEEELTYDGDLEKSSNVLLQSVLSIANKHVL